MLWRLRPFPDFVEPCLPLAPHTAGLFSFQQIVHVAHGPDWVHRPSSPSVHGRIIETISQFSRVEAIVLACTQAFPFSECAP
jgi:hypothetical protein